LAVRGVALVREHQRRGSLVEDSLWPETQTVIALQKDRAEYSLAIFLAGANQPPRREYQQL